MNRILSRRVERRGHLVTDCFPYPHTDLLSRSIDFPQDIMLIHVIFFWSTSCWVSSWHQPVSIQVCYCIIRMPNQPVKVPPTKALMDAVIRHAHRSVTTEKNTASGRPKFLEVPEVALG